MSLARARGLAKLLGSSSMARGRGTWTMAPLDNSMREPGDGWGVGSFMLIIFRQVGTLLLLLLETIVGFTGQVLSGTSGRVLGVRDGNAIVSELLRGKRMASTDAQLQSVRYLDDSITNLHKYRWFTRSVHICPSPSLYMLPSHSP